MDNFNLGECPFCNNTSYEKHGTYERNIISYNNGKKLENKIKIKRVRCKKCKRTHAIIPIFIVPYKIHNIEYINNVLKERRVKGKTYKMIEEKKLISRQLTSSWEKCLNKHESRIKITLDENKIERAIKKIIESVYAFIERYYQEHQIIYMMYINKNKTVPILKLAPT